MPQPMATTPKKPLKKSAGKAKATKSVVQHHNHNNHLPGSVNLKCKNCSGYEEKIHAESGEILHEIGLMAKHEIIAEMACHLGNRPEHLALAEQVFDSMRYQITEYVIKHEFNRENKVSVQMALWLDHKKEPAAASSLTGIIQKYLQPKKH